MIVAGETGNSTISGYFIFRGQEVPFEVRDAADYESYNFVKVNHEDPKVRAQFNDYLSWEGSNLPGKFADGKIFK
jgi:elongation factor 1-gamma